MSLTEPKESSPSCSHSQNANVRVCKHVHAQKVLYNLQGRPKKRLESNLGKNRKSSSNEAKTEATRGLHTVWSSWWPSDSPCQSRQTGDLTGFLDATACTADTTPHFF